MEPNNVPTMPGNGASRRSLQQPPSSARNSRQCIARPGTAGARSASPHAPRRFKGEFVGEYGDPTTTTIETWHGDDEGHQPAAVKPSWVTTRITQTFKSARVLMYQHRDLEDGQVLEVFAKDLLEALHEKREGESKKHKRPRPLFFICHSVGGIAVKMAMVFAGSEQKGFEQFKPIWKDTYSIAFFGTPHFGSKFLATKMLMNRIMQILALCRPLPQSIRKQLQPSTTRNPNDELEALNKRFRLLVGEMWIWTFTESRELSFTVKPEGGKDVTFWEPVTSFRSAIIGYRHEIIRPVARATHSDLAYFANSEDLTERYLSWFHYFYEKASFMIQAPFATGDVEDQVNDVKREVLVEIRGVFQGEGDSQAPNQQYWNARGYLRDVINRGPLSILRERLDTLTSSTSLQDENITSEETSRALAMGRARSSSARVLSQADYFGEPGYIWDEEDGEDSEQGVIENKPSMQSLLYSWVHLPWNNPVWVPDLLRGVAEDCPLNLAELEKDQHWGYLFANGRLNSHHSKFLAPGCGMVPMNPFDSKSKGNVCAYIHFPYMHFDSYRSVVRRRHTVASRWNRGRTAPVPLQIAKDESLERRIIYKYLGYSPPYQLRRTLDQFGYPEITQLGISARDDDQVLYKRSKERLAAGYRPAKRRDAPEIVRGHSLRKKSTLNDEHLPSPSTAANKSKEGWSWSQVLSKAAFQAEKPAFQKPTLPNRPTDLNEVEQMKEKNEQDVTGLEESTHALDGNMLMVDQLWLRVCQAGDESSSATQSSSSASLASQRDTLVSFFTEREETSKTENPQLSRYSDLRDTINEQLRDDSIHIEDIWDLAALCVSSAVCVLLDNTSQDEMHIWRIFQEDISDQAEQLTTSLKIFKEETLPDKEIGFSATPASILSRHKAEREKETKKYRANLTALVELRDISDELGILQKLFDQQKKVVEDVRKMIMEGMEDGTVPRRYEKDPMHRTGIRLLDNAMKKLIEYSEKVSEMRERVTSTREAFEKHLAMVQSQSQVIETRNSRLQADLAGSQGRSLLTFTVTTIVFLPLSYFSSLFGMNSSTPIDELSLGSIMAIMFPISAFIICLALVFAFSETVAKSWEGFMRGSSRVWNKVPVVRQARKRGGSSGKKKTAPGHDHEEDEDALLTFKNNAFLGNRMKKPYVIPWENLNEEGRQRRKAEQMEQKKADEAQKRRQRREARGKVGDA
ncbi:hypothetical protein MKZ38_008296 [Zalerion maritima]|uniref:DUF676 domain-containing protein n=1 Tax=Zalerion maritima TaxID=339359 RepID=A0AAD5WMJ4_9PEZI|nr:hypothetical protein MKZ38_008296 [Zalerion maritima]